MGKTEIPASAKQQPVGPRGALTFHTAALRKIKLIQEVHDMITSISSISMLEEMRKDQGRVLATRSVMTPPEDRKKSSEIPEGAGSLQRCKKNGCLTDATAHIS